MLTSTMQTVRPFCSSRSTQPRPSQAHRVQCVCRAEAQRPAVDIRQRAGSLLAGLAAAAVALSAGPAAAGVRLPPLSNDPNRCDRAMVGNTIGQANAVSDTVLDLRMCNLAGKNLQGLTLSGALLVDADLSDTNMREVVMSKAYAVGANFHGADMSNSVVDRVAFDKSDLSGVKFHNAVITGATFAGTNLEGASFDDALIGGEDAKRLCANPTLTGESRLEVGCRQN